MICSLILGRKGSVGFPGKNTHKIMGKPLAWYPMMAAKSCNLIDQNFISTDDEDLKILGSTLNFTVIDRPEYFATSGALGEDAYKHGFEEINKIVEQDIEFLVLLFCNAATINSDLISEGIALLRDNPDADSAVTVSKYNMYSPLRARKITNGFLEPFIPFENFESVESLNCDRDSQGDVWFADVSVSVIRPKNLINLDEGQLPQRWMGQKILPIINNAGFDLDYEWQIGQVEWWLKNHNEKK